MSLVGQPRSRFSLTAPLPSAAAGQIEQASFSSMVDEAKSRIPDAQTFLKALMDQDMHTGALETFTGAVNDRVASYLEEYQKDPFFSFTKQGRNTVKTLQQIVNSPAIRAAVDAKKHNVQQLDNVEKNKMLDAIVIDQGRVRGLNTKTGEVEWFRLGEMPEDFQPLNVVEDFQYLDQREPTRRVNYNYSALDDIEQRIRQNLSGTGYDEYKTEYDKIVNLNGQSGMIGVTEGGRNNIKQLEAMQKLTYNMLSEADRNTLYNQYIRTNPSSLRDPNFHQNAERWILDRIMEVAEGRRISSREVGYGESATAKAVDSGAGSQRERPIGNAQRIESGANAPNGVPLVVAQQVGPYTSVGTTNKIIPMTDLTKDAREVMIGGDKNNKRKSFAIEDLPVMEKAFDINNSYVISIKDENQGNFHKLNAPIGKGTIVDPSKPHGIVTLNVDRMGNPIPLKIVEGIQEKRRRNARPDEFTHEELRYLDYNPETGQYYMHAGQFGAFNVISQDRKGFVGSKINPQLQDELLETVGYKGNDENGKLLAENSQYSMDQNLIRPDKGIGYTVYLPYRGTSALTAAMDDVSEFGPGEHVNYTNFQNSLTIDYVTKPEKSPNEMNVHF